MATLAERFWAKVDKAGPVPVLRPDLGPCHLWTGGTSPEGYGRFWVDGRLVGAHRVALSLAGRPAPPGLDACHHCDNPPCVNDAHLFAGTVAENLADAAAKGRRRFAVGEAASGAKLGVAQVLAIRDAVAAGRSYRSVGRDYGLHHRSVSDIARGVTWRHC